VRDPPVEGPGLGGLGQRSAFWPTGERDTRA
jgi:hypothetical protein